MRTTDPPSVPSEGDRRALQAAGAATPARRAHSAAESDTPSNSGDPRIARAVHRPRMIRVALPPLSPNSPLQPRPPDGLPELQAGAHLIPEDGACLMEYVSVLVGAPFNDHPRCTDPTLASLARLVNDSCTDAARPLLTAFAPVLAETPPGDARRTATIARAAVRTAHTAAGETALRRHLRHAECRYERVTRAGRMAAVSRRLDPLYRRGRGRLHLEASVAALRVLPEPQRDAALIATLAAAIAAASPLPRPPSASWSGQLAADGRLSSRPQDVVAHEAPPPTSVGPATEPVIQ